MPEVLRAMQTAVGRRSPSRRHTPRFLRGAGLGVLIAIAGGSGLAVAGAWDPIAALSREHPKTYVLTPPSARQSETLSVLRRPQNAADQDPLFLAFLRRGAGTGVSDPRGEGVHVRYVRFLRPITPTSYAGPMGRVFDRTERRIFVLIPRERLGGVDLRQPVCAWTISDPWASQTGGTMPPTPPSERPPRPKRLVDRVSGGGGCATIQQIREKGLMSASFGTGAIFGVVPDGVATVRATTLADQVISAPVENNSFELLAPDRNVEAKPVDRMHYSVRSGRFRHQSVEWLDASGKVIRHISQ